MEKISEHLGKDFSMVRLYRDDLRHLESILTQTSDEVTWTTGNYKFESLQELLDNYKKNEIKELLINSRLPWTTIELRHYRSSISVISNEPKDEGIFSQLCKVIEPTEQKFQFLFSFKTYWIVLITYFIAKYAFDFEVHPALHGSFLTFLVSLPIYGSWIKSRRNTLIKLIERHEDSNFWNRNKDKVILLLIGGLIGAAITFLIDQLISGR
ncbi:MAG: hypothetical protein ABJG41_01760 [Cyclobacteriaceae bacterium]